MGIGFSCTCKSCNYTHRFFIGSGYLYNPSLEERPTEKVLFICPECGWWKEAKLELDDNKERKCYKCKSVMNTYKQNLGFENIDSLPDLLCKKCGQKFKPEEKWFCWD